MSEEQESMTELEAVAAWNRALDLHRKGELREAEAIYRRLLQNLYAFPEVYYHLGLVELDTGRHADALASLLRAIELEPHNPDFHHRAGRAHAAAGRLAEAAASYARAIELRVSHQEAQEDLTRLQASGSAGEEYNLVSIITPTIGRPELARAIRSVSAQRYRNIEHLVVADGPEVEARVREIVAATAPTVPTSVLALPWNTGRNGFLGHRIIAATIHFVNGRFVSFLDDDNWLDEDHVSSLVSCAIEFGLEWAYSLRKIVRADGSFLARDDCHSLGAWESIIRASGDGGQHLVDTSCYLLRRDVAISYSGLWHRRSGDARRSPDVVFCEALLARKTRFRTTGKYTLNYSIGPARPTGERFFLDGNAEMRRRYPNGFPWAN